MQHRSIRTSGWAVLLALSLVMVMSIDCAWALGPKDTAYSQVYIRGNFDYCMFVMRRVMIHHRGTADTEVS